MKKGIQELREDIKKGLKMDEASASLAKKVLADGDVIDAVLDYVEESSPAFVPFGLTDANKKALVSAIFGGAKVAFDTCDTEDAKKVKAKWAAKGYKVLYTLDNMDSTAFGFVANPVKESVSLREGIVSNKDGDKTFDQLYANGIDLDEQDTEWSSCFGALFESVNGTKISEAAASLLKGVLADKGFINAVVVFLGKYDSECLDEDISDEQKKAVVNAVFSGAKVKFLTCIDTDAGKVKVKWAKDGYKVVYSIDKSDWVGFCFAAKPVKESANLREGTVDLGQAADIIQHLEIPEQYDSDLLSVKVIGDEVAIVGFGSSADAAKLADWFQTNEKVDSELGDSMCLVRAVSKGTGVYLTFDKRLDEAAIKPASRRVREGIVSNKDGDKTFDQLYADGIDLDEQDEMFAKQFSHCFESANGKPANRLRESSDGVKKNFHNKYLCDCGAAWEDDWDSTCDDRCPECNATVSPFESEDLRETGTWGVFRLGGAIGERKSDEPIAEYSGPDAHEDALAHARRLRSMLSKGEKLYYGARRTDK